DAAIGFLREQPSVNRARVFALGHSEGGQLVPLVASAGAPVAGIALMAPPALPLDQVIAKQLPAQSPMLERIERTDWFKSYLGIDPAKTIAHVHQPILILQGEEDRNVLAPDALRLVNAAKATNHDVTYKLYPHDAHEFLVLKPGQTMLDTATVIDPALIDDLIAWLKAHARG
ncbi:MAG: prolyl oligopeptidase family serine peptidase, partial [Candidatus Baltobacteraceae bacterium]